MQAENASIEDPATVGSAKLVQCIRFDRREDVRYVSRVHQDLQAWDFHRVSRCHCGNKKGRADDRSMQIIALSAFFADDRCNFVKPPPTIDRTNLATLSACILDVAGMRKVSCLMAATEDRNLHRLCNDGSDDLKSTCRRLVDGRICRCNNVRHSRSMGLRC